MGVATVITQTEPFEFPSIMRGLPFETYVGIEALNSHGAQTIMDLSPYHFRWHRDNDEDEPSPAKRLGTLFHELVLEPERNAYRVIPDGADKASNANKLALVNFYCASMECEPPYIDVKLADGKLLSAQLEILEEQFSTSGLYAVKQAAFDAARQMRDGLFSKRVARALFADGEAEVTLLWEDREFGARKKARVDWLPEGHDLMVDIKSIDSAGWAEAMKSIARYGYRPQAAHYLEGGNACGLPHHTFALAFVESSKPYQSRIVYFDNDDIAEGSNRMRVATKSYSECVASGHWPGYPEEIEKADLPKWSK